MVLLSMSKLHSSIKTSAQCKSVLIIGMLYLSNLGTIWNKTPWASRLVYIIIYWQYSSSVSTLEPSVIAAISMLNPFISNSLLAITYLLVATLSMNIIALPKRGFTLKNRCKYENLYSLDVSGLNDNVMRKVSC